MPTAKLMFLSLLCCWLRLKGSSPAPLHPRPPSEEDDVLLVQVLAVALVGGRQAVAVAQTVELRAGTRRLQVALVLERAHAVRVGWGGRRGMNGRVGTGGGLLGFQAAAGVQGGELV